MKNLKKRLKSQGGFTLVEMLIVVAIIAILVAVSIPLVNNSLEKTRKATDAANERAAKAAATVAYLSETVPLVTGGTGALTAEGTFRYDAVNGKLVIGSTDVDPYGKCTDHKSAIIQVKIDMDGGVTIQWYDTNTGSVVEGKNHNV